MAAYLIATIKEITDLEKIQQYREKAWPTVHKYGGESLIKPQSRHEFLEGPRAEGMVVLRFPSYEQALAWYHSEEYQAAAQIRYGIADLRVVIAEAESEY